MTTQLRLAWPHAPDFTAESFIDSAATDEARRMLAAWRDWPARALALIGPEGAGKSHLAAIWAEETGAAPPDRAGWTGAVLAEDADRAGWDDMALFRLLERAASHQAAGVLLTARARPAEWPARMPDLASRLRALAFVEIGPPDDAALSQILRKLLRERHLRVEDRVIDYVLRRIERTAPAAHRAVDMLDRAAAERGARVSLRLAAETLSGESARQDLADMGPAAEDQAGGDDGWDDGRGGG